MYLPFVTKRLSFAEEQEVRAVIDVKPEGENGHFRLKEDICEVGMPYAVDLKKLIKEVVVGPLARDNFVQNVQSLVDEPESIAKLKFPPTGVADGRISNV